MKCTVVFQYLICDLHFGIMKSELILEISVGILSVFSDKLFFLNSARRQIQLFANKKKDSVDSGSLNYCQSNMKLCW